MQITCNSSNKSKYTRHRVTIFGLGQSLCLRHKCGFCICGCTRNSDVVCTNLVTWTASKSSQKRKYNRTRIEPPNLRVLDCGQSAGDFHRLIRDTMCRCYAAICRYRYVLMIEVSGDNGLVSLVWWVWLGILSWLKVVLIRACTKQFIPTLSWNSNWQNVIKHLRI